MAERAGEAVVPGRRAVRAHGEDAARPVRGIERDLRDAAVVDANSDSLPDILLVGNFYENNIQMGRYDADYTTLLVNQGNGKFSVSTLNGEQIRGQVRHISPLKTGREENYILARNNDSTLVIRFKK